MGHSGRGPPLESHSLRGAWRRLSFFSGVPGDGLLFDGQVAAGAGAPQPQRPVRSPFASPTRRWWWAAQHRGDVGEPILGVPYFLQLDVLSQQLALRLVPEAFRRSMTVARASHAHR